MPSTSYRGRSVNESPIRSLVPFAQQAKESGKHVYHLNIGQPDIETPPDALEFVREHDVKVVKYGLSAGLPELRREVAKYYEKFDVNIDYQDVYVTIGASEAILFALFSCCDAGDEVILQNHFMPTI